MSLTLCLWVGLCVWTWDTDHGFVTLVAAFVASLILLLPAAFCIGLIVRYAELIGWYLRKSQNRLQSELESSSLAVSFRMGPSRIARQIIHQAS